MSCFDGMLVSWINYLALVGLGDSCVDALLFYAFSSTFEKERFYE